MPLTPFCAEGRGRSPQEKRQDMEIDQKIFLGLDLIQLVVLMIIPLLFVFAVYMGTTAKD